MNRKVLGASRNRIRYKVCSLSSVTFLAIQVTHNNLTMNFRYVKLLVILALFSQVKGFCGKKRETKCYLILAECLQGAATFLVLWHCNFKANLTLREMYFVSECFTVCRSPRYDIFKKIYIFFPFFSYLFSSWDTFVRI